MDYSYKNQKKKSLERNYQGLFREAYRLSTINRKAYDEKSAEANRVFFGLDRGRGDGFYDGTLMTLTWQIDTGRFIS